VQETITPEMMQEAIRVFTQESRTIRQEAEEGNTRQQHNLAVLYTLGLGVPLDHQTAFKWFNKAANEGLAESQFNVAIALQGGLGTRKDLVTSYKYYILAAAQGTIPPAARARDYLAQYLNREQIESGQRMARGFLTALERRRYYERRRELETKRMEAIRKGQDPTAVGPTGPEN
jgi:TPR repeat protein